MWEERCWRCRYQGKTKHGRPCRKYLDMVKEDMQEVGAREDEVFDRIV